MATYTKGNWIATRGSHKYPLEITTETRTIAQIETQKTIEEVDANAQLIAAAPDLLVVSHNLVETMGIDYAIKKLSISDDIIAIGASVILKGIQRQAKEAIAKAKGE